MPERIIRRVVLVISSMGAGGAERVLALLANRWAEQEIEVTLVAITAGEPAYAMDRRIRLIALGSQSQSGNLARAAWSNFCRIRQLRRVFKRARPHCIISFLHSTNVLTLLASVGLRVPVIVSERADPRVFSDGVPWVKLRSFLYPSADAVVVQTHGLADLVEKAWGERVVVIANPVDDSFWTVDSAPRRPIVVSVGRLVSSKRFDLLISAFASLSPRFPTWTLIIAGEGPARPALEAQIDRLGLRCVVRLAGHQDSVAGLLHGAEIFALASASEGSPNVLAEAMAAGCAIVATDCPFGPSELLEDGISGRLIGLDQPSELAAVLEQLMKDERLRRNMATAAQQSARKYRVAVIAGEWERLMRTVIHDRESYV